MQDTPLLATALQCVFTLVFGVYVGRMYARHGSIVTCVAVHALCNAVGFPDLAEVGRLPARRLFGMRRCG